MTARFPNVSCSHCGGDFGPGEHGFSHCENHAGLRRLSWHEVRKIEQDYEMAGLKPPSDIRIMVSRIASMIGTNDMHDARRECLALLQVIDGAPSQPVAEPATPPQAGRDLEQQQFEAFAYNPGPDSANLDLSINSRGDYASDRTDGAWHGWQARGRFDATPPVAESAPSALEPYAWFWSHNRGAKATGNDGVLTLRQDYEQHKRDYPGMEFTPVVLQADAEAAIRKARDQYHYWHALALELCERECFSVCRNINADGSCPMDIERRKAMTDKTESAGQDLRSKIARTMHYPEHWEISTYPTLESAIWAFVACHFDCTDESHNPPANVLKIVNAETIAEEKAELERGLQVLRNAAPQPAPEQQVKRYSLMREGAGTYVLYSDYKRDLSAATQRAEELLEQSNTMYEAFVAQQDRANKLEASLKEREAVALNRAADLVNDRGLWTLAAEIRALADKPEGK